MANITFKRPELANIEGEYTQIRDCINGQESIKKKGDVYLPRPDSCDKSAENKARYEAYILRAMFYGVVGRTLQGLVGQIFMREPKTIMPSTLQVLEQDANGAGVGITQL